MANLKNRVVVLTQKQANALVARVVGKNREAAGIMKSIDPDFQGNLKGTNFQ